MHEPSYPLHLAAGDARNGIETPVTPSAAASSQLAGRKRSTASSDETQLLRPGDEGSELRKIRKVSRACDFCKSRKARCTGDQPCAKCVAKGRVCLYDAKYTRGRPPTPPPSDARSKFSSTGTVVAGEGLSELDSMSMACKPSTEVADDMDLSRQYPLPRSHESTAPSRASPELSMAEIQGQVFDPTSGLTFLHRALKRLSAQNKNGLKAMDRPVSENQPLMMAGDKPLPGGSHEGPFQLPDPAEGRKLLALYFDVCIATYRILHQPTVEGWLSTMEKNLQDRQPIWHNVGRAKAAIVLVALAIAKLHQEKSKGFLSAEEEAQALKASDELYTISTRLAEEETGFPKLESAQARIVHVLYLLTTSRFNRGWYTFGNALQLISALGLHRRANSKRRRISPTDYIHTQCGIRTFWTAYVLDNYLGVVFGRPRHFHDEDIDQDFPDRVNDEEMTVVGPGDVVENPEDCHVDALLFHAKIAQIIGSISREVYSLRDISKDERLAAATKLIRRVNEWHASLPLHLGSIRPSMLIPSYRRQATVLKLAHSHAIMHANRLFLLGNSSDASEKQVIECIGAAKTVLETVDRLADEGPLFHAFWWTHYLTFCALVVTYVWEIQQRRAKRPIGRQDRTRLLELAERCQTHLAQATASNSPSRRYAVILEEFRTAATYSSARPVIVTTDPQQTEAALQQQGQEDVTESSLALNNTRPSGPGQGFEGADVPMMDEGHLFDEWHTTDWLDLDSSAFWPHMDIDENILWPNLT
ncbi:hypothetical protein ACJ41O_007244 [Fusarium nematophilum]